MSDTVNFFLHFIYGVNPPNNTIDTSPRVVLAVESSVQKNGYGTIILACYLSIQEFTKSNILNRVATALLLQANMAPQTVLQLLG